MSLDVYLRLQAAKEGRAQPRAARRHAYLSARPLVVTGYHLAGDPGAPVALRYGSRPDRSWTVVVGEPRDRSLRFARLAGFAADLARWLAGFAARKPVERLTRSGMETELLCPEAPQLVCPNATTAAWLTDLLGRSLRFLRPDGEHPVDPGLPVAGAHLSFFAQRRALPGSSAVLAATELLTAHWCTGQLPAEDRHLGTVLAWVDPPGGSGARATALAAEAGPPAGPESHPAWDREVLQPLVGEYGRARAGGVPDAEASTELAEVCGAALEPAWRDTWAALGLVGSLPEAAHVAQRWTDDRRAWTGHLGRVAAGTARFRSRLDQLQSFRFLHELERRTTALARQMALDDPLLMAAQVAAGEAVAGEVVARDCAHRRRSPAGRALRRPMLTLRPAVPFTGQVGMELWWAGDPRVRAVVVSDKDSELGLMVVAGACASQARAEEILPEPGARISLLGSGEDRFPDRLPETLPWTHAPAGERAW